MKLCHVFVNRVTHIDPVYPILTIRASDAERRLFNSPTRLPFLSNTIIHEALSGYWRINFIMEAAPASKVDVLIIGAGPAGLMLSLWMAKLGVKTRVVDKRTGKIVSGQADG